MNNNAVDTGTIVNNTFKDMVFGTAGSALTECVDAELWKLIDEVNGTWEYKGLEPFDGSVTGDITAISSGGNQEFRIKWQKDTGGGFANLTDNVEALMDIGGTADSFTKTIPFQANLGDKIKPQLTRNAGASDITTSYVTINIFSN